MSNSKSTFWADLSKKTGTWSAVAVLAVSVLEILDEDLAGIDDGLGWKHAAVVVGTACVRAIVGLIQGNVGDRTKATFSKPPADPDAE